MDSEKPVTNDQAARTFPATWAGMMAFLDEQYPIDVFPENAVLDANDDLGPRTVRLMRELALLRGGKPQATAVIDRMREQAGEIHRLRIALDVASAELTDERDEARARVAAVRAVHAEIRVDDEGYRGCVHCGGDYPCDTLQALDGPS